MGTARIFQWFGDENTPASNAPAAVAAEASGASAPTNGQQLRRRHRAFDSATDEGLFFVYLLPSNYASGGTLTIQHTSDATSGNVIWKTAYAIMTPGTTDFDGLAFGTVTAATASATHGTAGVATTKSIDLGVSGAAAGDILFVYLGRDADNASDTVNSNDVELMEPWLFTFNVV